MAWAAPPTPVPLSLLKILSANFFNTSFHLASKQALNYRNTDTDRWVLWYGEMEKNKGAKEQKGLHLFFLCRDGRWGRLKTSCRDKPVKKKKQKEQSDKT